MFPPSSQSDPRHWLFLSAADIICFSTYIDKFDASGIFANDRIGSFLIMLMAKVAFNSGSSKHGIAFLVSVAAIIVTARNL